jgi:AraC-like DNA-binding protein
MDAISSHEQHPIGVLLGAAVQYIHEHLSEELTRDDVAKVACLSPSHFSRVIKQTYGYSFTELVARLRVEKARELLARTEKSLLQIAMESGFNEQSYFTRVFQKYTGRPPGEYRKHQRSRRL